MFIYWDLGVEWFLLLFLFLFFYFYKQPSCQKQPTELYFAKICVRFLRSLFLEHIKFSRRLECNKKIYCEFFRRHNSFIRTHQIFQENQKWQKNTYKFSRRGKMYLNRSNFPGELSQNFVRTHMIFQGIIPQEQIFCKIASSVALELPRLQPSNQPKN